MEQNTNRKTEEREFQQSRSNFPDIKGDHMIDEKIANKISLIIPIITLLIGMTYGYGFIFCQYSNLAFGYIPYDNLLYLSGGFYPLCIVLICVFGGIFLSFNFSYKFPYTFILFILLICSAPLNFLVQSNLKIGLTSFILIILAIMLITSSICVTRLYMDYLESKKEQKCTCIMALFYGAFIILSISCSLPMYLSHFPKYISNYEFCEVFIKNEDKKIHNEKLKMKIVYIDEQHVYGYKIQDQNDSTPTIINNNRIDHIDYIK